MKSVMTLFIVLYSFGNVSAHATKCVQIFYDRAPHAPSPYTYGRLHALYVQNLIGHFPAIQQYVIPIEKYESGQLDNCRANIYLGTYFDNPLPETFLYDFTTTSKNVLWAGYNIWQLGHQHLKDIWGVKYAGLSGLHWTPQNANEPPGFYKYYDYRQETFVKYGAFDSTDPSIFHAAYEITLFELLDGGNPGREVISWARHSSQDKTTPYIIKAHHRWYVGDSPFSYVTPEDRYLIFADLLFDVLEEKTRHQEKHPALVRFEDIHPLTPLWQIEGLVNAATKVGIPFGISLIPVFADPYMVEVKEEKDKLQNLRDRPTFIQAIKQAEKQKGSIIFHGLTHQADNLKNPKGVTGFDYEFWNVATNSPLEYDSPSFLLDRVETGFSLMKDSGIKPVVWLTPHYAASPADNIIFGQLFLWNAGRIIYFAHRASQERSLPILLTLDLFGTTANGHRLRYFADLKVEYRASQNPGGQFFPYEIYGDVYGQRLIPENAGYIRPSPHSPSGKEVLVDDIIRILERNRVIRDAWGSFFIHPNLLSKSDSGGMARWDGDNREIERLFQSAVDLGYEFVDLESWTRDNLKPKRLPPIEMTMETDTYSINEPESWNPIGRLLRYFLKSSHLPKIHEPPFSVP